MAEVLSCANCGSPLPEDAGARLFAVCEYCGATTHVADGTLVTEAKAAAADDSIPDDPNERYAWARQRLTRLSQAMPGPVTYEGFTAALRTTLAVEIECGPNATFISGKSYEDVDQVMRIAYNLASDYRGESGVDLDGPGLLRLAEGCLEALHALRTQPEYQLNLPFICADASGPKHYLRQVDAALMDALAAREPAAPGGLAADDAAPPKSLWRKLFG